MKLRSIFKLLVFLLLFIYFLNPEKVVFGNTPIQDLSLNSAIEIARVHNPI